MQRGHNFSSKHSSQSRNQKRVLQFCCFLSLFFKFLMEFFPICSIVSIGNFRSDWYRFVSFSSDATTFLGEVAVSIWCSLLCHEMRRLEGVEFSNWVYLCFWFRFDL